MDFDSCAIIISVGAHVLCCKTVSENGMTFLYWRDWKAICGYTTHTLNYRLQLVTVL